MHTGNMIGEMENTEKYTEIQNTEIQEPLGFKPNTLNLFVAFHEGTFTGNIIGEMRNTSEHQIYSDQYL